MQRRTLFKLGVASAALLAVAGGATVLVRPGLEQGTLTARGREIFVAVGSAILDKTIPATGAQRDLALSGLVDRIDALVGALPPHAQTELSQLLALLATPPGRQLLAGLSEPWAKASVIQVQAALQSMRFSSFQVRNQAYAALHDISAGAYFADSSTWSFLGYPGPLTI